VNDEIPIPGKDYREVIQDFFTYPQAAPSSVREDAIAAKLIPGIETDAKKKEKIEIKRKNELRRRTIQTLMATDQGREWLYDLLNMCNAFGTPFNQDTHLTAYNCGALYVGRSLEGDIINFSADSYSLMRKEALERDRLMDEHINQDDAKAE
jgi:hypothetical protein